jgi:hypothetical protein
MRRVVADLDLEQVAEPGACDGTADVIAELGVPTGRTVTIAHRTARRPLFRIAFPRCRRSGGSRPVLPA